MRLRLHTPDPARPGSPFGEPGSSGVRGSDSRGAADEPRAESGAPATQPSSDQRAATHGGRRLNLLLTYGGWREHAFADQLPLILDRFGIRCYRAQCGDEASEVIRRERVHIAVIDMSIPMHPTRARECTPAVTAGPRVLQLLRRLEQPPPTIVVRPRQADEAESSRTLADALRDGAFTVLDDPVPIESMLQALERVVRRHYRDHWPAA